MKIYLLRHGRTLWNEAGRLQGRTDIPLSEDGRAAARAAGRALSDIAFDAAFSSPLRRARETAELILAGRGVAVQTDARLVELSFGAAEEWRWKRFHRNSGRHGGCFPIRHHMCRLTAERATHP